MLTARRLALLFYAYWTDACSRGLGNMIAEGEEVQIEGWFTVVYFWA